MTPSTLEATGLLDTSVVVLLDRLDASTLPITPAISAITLAELAAGPATAKTPHEAALRILRLQQAEADFEAIPFDAAAARAFGVVSADLRAAGRKVTARAFDALIASTAIAHGLPLHTLNPKDFDGIEGLDVVAIAHPDA